MTDFEFLVLHSNSWNQKELTCLKMLSIKCVYKSYIFDICIKTIGIK